VAAVVAMTKHWHARRTGNEAFTNEIEGSERGGRGLFSLEVAHQADADRPAVVPLHVRAEPVERTPAKDPARGRDDEVIADRREPALAVPALDLAHVLRLRGTRRTADRTRGRGRVVHHEVVERPAPR
jgi:hypothetical protein